MSWCSTGEEGAAKGGGSVDMAVAVDASSSGVGVVVSMGLALAALAEVETLLGDPLGAAGELRLPARRRLLLLLPAVASLMTEEGRGSLSLGAAAAGGGIATRGRGGRVGRGLFLPPPLLAPARDDVAGAGEDLRPPLLTAAGMMLLLLLPDAAALLPLARAELAPRPEAHPCCVSGMLAHG